MKWLSGVVSILTVLFLGQCMQHETLPGRFAGRLTAEVGPHSCKLFILTPVGR
jgi:hypothetical protein